MDGFHKPIHCSVRAMKKIANIEIEYCNSQCPHFYYKFDDNDRIWCGLSGRMIFDDGDLPNILGDVKKRSIPSTCLLQNKETKLKREIRVNRSFLNILRHTIRNDHNYLIESIELAYDLIIHEFGQDEEFGGSVFVYIDLNDYWLHLRVGVDPMPNDCMARIEKICKTLENVIPYSSVELVGVTI